MGQELKNWLIVIPARIGATRLPEKPLVDLGGKPLIVRVAENLAPLVKEGAHVVVATDSERIAEACRTWNIPAEMTSAAHESGTDRVYEVACARTEPFILNVQGDEPFINLEDLRALMQVMERSPAPDIGTIVHPCSDQDRLNDPNTVKVVRNQKHEALYFSRAPVPFPRNQLDVPSFLIHIGVYAFTKTALEAYCALPPSTLETTERLEQLRALEAGMTIKTTTTDTVSLGIDTEADLERARELLK